MTTCHLFVFNYSLKHLSCTTSDTTTSLTHLDISSTAQYNICAKSILNILQSPRSRWSLASWQQKDDDEESDLLYLLSAISYRQAKTNWYRGSQCCDQYLLVWEEISGWRKRMSGCQYITYPSWDLKLWVHRWSDNRITGDDHL